MSQITEKIWISPGNVAREKDFLLDNNIGYIINCAEEESTNYPNQIPFTHIPMIDDEDIHAMDQITKGAHQIQIALKEDRNVLVHCKAGISRSATVVLAYLIIYKNMKFNDAYKLVQRERPIIRPNTFYVCLLKMLEESTH